MTDTFRQQMDRELGLLGIQLSEKQDVYKRQE